MKTLADYPGLYYHLVTPGTAAIMADLRHAYIGLADLVLQSTPPSREQSFALTHLEDSLMRAMQSLAIYSPGSVQQPVPSLDAAPPEEAQA